MRAMRPSRNVKSMKISPSRNGISRNRGPAMLTITLSPGCEKLETLDAPVVLIEAGTHALDDGDTTVAQELWQNSLMHDVRVEAVGERRNVASPARVEVVEHDLESRIAHRISFMPSVARQGVMDRDYRR